MRGATKVALVAAIGSLLQGWDNGAIAGGLLYIKPEFRFEDKPMVEGIVVAATLVGAVCSTMAAGPGADWIGRRMVLCCSAMLDCVSACLMLWAPSVGLLIVARFLIGTGIGLAATMVPVFIAESAPSEIRGQLATLPQLLGSAGLFLAYTLVFFFSLTPSPNWRLMLGILLVPSLVYLLLAVFYLPESPRWLVSKGRMAEAKRVLQRLRDKEDVSAELALLVEGLGIGGEHVLEEWVLRPAVEEMIGADGKEEQSQIKLYAPDEGIAWIATPIPEEAPLMSRAPSVVGSMVNLPKSGLSLIDPVVTLMGSLQQAQEHFQSELQEEAEAQQHEHEAAADEAVESTAEPDEEEADVDMVGHLDDEDGLSLRAPLLTRRRYDQHEQSEQRVQDGSAGREELEQDEEQPLEDDDAGMFVGPHGDRHGSALSNVAAGEAIGSVGIGGGWQLAWQWTGHEGGEGVPEEGAFKRVFLLQEAPDGVVAKSAVSLPGIGEESIPAAALVGQPAQYVLEDMEEVPVGPAMLHPAKTAIPGPAWSDLLVGGVRRALVVGLSLQALQQFSGINAVLYFIPQILQQSGADALLADVGIGADSTSILGSAVVSLFMLPCVVLAMRFMDRAGRRQLLLGTLPVLLVALVGMTVSNMVFKAGLLQAAVSFLGVGVYACSFVMGFGPVPNILCAEIFPTRVRGLCIGICQATFWACNIIVTYLFPILLLHLGLAGVFSLFAAVCLASWVFVFLKVPETKGLPLEVISEFFAVSHVEVRKGSMYVVTSS